MLLGTRVPRPELGGSCCGRQLLSWASEPMMTPEQRVGAAFPHGHSSPRTGFKAQSSRPLKGRLRLPAGGSSVQGPPEGSYPQLSPQWPGSTPGMEPVVPTL